MNQDTQTLIDELHRGLAGRPTPESIAARIPELIDVSLLSPAVRRDLAHSAGYAWHSLMSTEFAPVVVPQHGADVLAELIGVLPVSAADPDALATLIAQGRGAIGMSAGHTDFKADRANRAARRALGLKLSRRRYDKIFRLVARLEGEHAALLAQTRHFRLTRFAKTSFAADIPRAALTDPTSVAFVAYLAANMARRSLFTNGPQARAFDAIAEGLFGLLGDDADWFAIAQVFPRADVLAHLDQAQLLELLAQTHALLEQAAAGLEAAALTTEINFATMTVAAGQDSSTWNELAGAWNRARDYWLAIVAALGAHEITESFLPGKVLRLIAADVMAWHRTSGDTVHPDTPVAAALPRPWDVMAGRAQCGRALVEQACRSNGVDPVKTGWSSARVRTTVEATRLTPETVHGVVVTSPGLAAFLRRLDAFSARPPRALDVPLPDGWWNQVLVAERDGLRSWAVPAQAEER